MRIPRIVIVASVIIAAFLGVAMYKEGNYYSARDRAAKRSAPQSGTVHVDMPAQSCQVTADGAVSGSSEWQIVKQAFDAIGRTDDMAVVRATSFRGTNTIQRASGVVALHVERVTVFPANFYAVFQDSRGATTKIVDTPNFNFEIAGPSTMAIPTPQLEGIRIAVKLDPIYVAKYRSEFMCGIEGSELVGSINTTKLRISGDGAEEAWNVDAATGRLLSTSFDTTATGKVITNFSDWRSVGRIKVAYKRHSVTPTETDDVTVDQYEVNPKINSKLFDRPAIIIGAPSGAH